MRVSKAGLLVIHLSATALAMLIGVIIVAAVSPWVFKIDDYILKLME